MVLEAMKMEHTLVAPFDGNCGRAIVREGDQVAEGVLLVKDPEDPAAGHVLRSTPTMISRKASAARW